MENKKIQESIVKIADAINNKRREELFQVYDSTDLFREIKRIKDQGIYKHGNKSKTMRKIATIPQEVDIFFTKIYGENYYKEKDFFTKYHPEWIVIDKQ